MLAIRIHGTEGGEGRVRQTAQFLAESDLYRADILKDAIYELRELYEAACTAAFAGFPESDDDKPL